MSEAVRIVLTTVHSILVIVAIVGHSLVCWIIKKYQDMRTNLNYLILNVAVADMMYAIFIAPKFFVKLAGSHPDGVSGLVLCKLLTDGNIAWIGGASSIVTLVAIALERYYAVVYPLGNKGKLTKRKLKMIIAGSWIFSSLFNIPLFLVVGFNKATNSCAQLFPEEWMATVNSWAWLLLPALSTALMAGLYSRVVYTLWFKNNNDGQLTFQQQGVIKVRKRVTLMVAAVSAIFGICWCSASVIYILSYMYSTSLDYGAVLLPISYTVILFSSVVNPFAYALLNQQFRKKMKTMISCVGFFSFTVQPGGEPQGIEADENEV